MLFAKGDVINAALENQIITHNEFGEKHCNWKPPPRT